MTTLLMQRIREIAKPLIVDVRWDSESYEWRFDAKKCTEKSKPCGNSCQPKMSRSGKPTQCRKALPPEMQAKVEEAKKMLNDLEPKTKPKTAANKKKPDPSPSKPVEAKPSSKQSKAPVKKTEPSKPSLGESPDDYIQETAFGYEIKVPDEVMKKLPKGATILENVSDRDNPFKVNYGKEKDRSIVERDARKLVEIYRQLTSTPSDLGLSEKARKLREKPKIKTEKEFDKALDEAFDVIKESNPGNNLVPIYKVRRALGDRVSRGDFDKMLFNAQAKDKYTMLEESVEDSSQDKITDSVVTGMGKIRAYVKRG